MSTETLFDVALPAELTVTRPGSSSAVAHRERLNSGLAVVPAGPRSQLVIVGIDLSLAATGVAGNTGGGWADTISAGERRGHERMSYIRNTIIDRYLRGVDIVAIEGPSYGSQAGQAGHHERAGLWWLITHHLWSTCVPTVVIPPASLKKYVTGKGNAGKDAMLKSIVRRFDWFDGDNNAADATGLAAMVADHYGTPMTTMPDLNRTALDGVQWPEVVGGATC